MPARKKTETRDLAPRSDKETVEAEARTVDEDRDAEYRRTHPTLTPNMFGKEKVVSVPEKPTEG